MSLESGTYISDLVAANPIGSDAKSQGDDHIRLLKSTIKNSFPAISGAVTLTHTQINEAARLSASNVFTGALQTLPGSESLRLDGGAGVSKTAYMRSSGTTAASAASTFYAGVNPFGTDGAYEIKPASGTDGIRIAPSGAVTIQSIAASDFARLSQTPQTFSGSTAGGRYVAAENTSSSSSAHVSFRAIDNGGGVFAIARVSSAYTGPFLSSGTAGPGSVLWSSGNVPLDIGTNDIARLIISGAGNYDFKGGTVTTSNASAAEVGYKGLPQNSQSIDYTAVLGDAAKNLHQTGATKTFTIPANASVAYPIGTALVFTVDNATGCSIAITTDTLRLAGTTTTGTRTLAQYGIATAVKILATTWIISGAGLS